MKQSLMFEIATSKTPVLTYLTWITFTPDPIGAMLAVPKAKRFMRFSAGEVLGLARLKGKHLEILAVESLDAGNGHFRAFINRLKAECDSITFWYIWNPWLPSVLERYGFRGVEEAPCYGERTTGMRWENNLNISLTP